MALTGKTIGELINVTALTDNTLIVIEISGITYNITRADFIGGGDVNPSIDNFYTLGNNNFRWKDIRIGQGSLYITDVVTGLEAEITVVDGVLLINGANQLQVGQLKFVNNNIQSLSGSTDIEIAQTGDTANIVLNRNTVISSGKTLTFGDGSVQDTAYIPPVANSFNPLFTDISGTTSGITTTGSYTMLSPKICYFRVYVDFSGCTNFGNSQYKITLPFPSKETMRQAGGTLHQTSGSSLFHICGITDITESATIHKLYYWGSTTDLAWKYNTPVGGTTTTSHFDISGTYEIQ